MVADGNLVFDSDENRDNEDEDGSNDKEAKQAFNSLLPADDLFA